MPTEYATTDNSLHYAYDIGQNKALLCTIERRKLDTYKLTVEPYYGSPYLGLSHLECVSF